MHSVQNLSVDNEMWITLNIINKLMGFLLFNGQVIFHYTHTHTHTHTPPPPFLKKSFATAWIDLEGFMLSEIS